MTKISKQTKLEAILEYFSGNKSKQEVAKRYGIHYTSFKMLLAAYKTHGSDVLFNPPKPTGKFRVELASWAIRNNASYTEVAAKFGYVGTAQIVKWKEIYGADVKIMDRFFRHRELPDSENFSKPGFQLKTA